jgi:hypothetical protein
VFRALAALALASTSTNSSAILTSSVPWWERVTVTVSDDGKTQSCRYESSLKPQGSKSCDVVESEAATAKGATSGAKDQYTRITFERRFNPGAKPSVDALQPGETLLGGQTLALAIDGKGAVKDCKVVQRSGSLPPQYGCEEASTEKFDANGATTQTAAATREGFMTVLVYGHSEHVV